MNSKKIYTRWISLGIIIIIGIVSAVLVLSKSYTAEKANNENANQEAKPNTGQVNNDTGYVLIKTSRIATLRSLVATEKLEEADKPEILNKLGIRRYKVKGDATAEEVANRIEARLRSEETSAFAEPDALAPATLIPNDPWYANWQNALRRISGPAAWDIETGESSIIIAILDSGISSSHEDMAGKLVPGKNVYDNSLNTEDDNGHGTSVASTASAAVNNSLGIAAVCWECKLMPVKITRPNDAWAYYSDMAEGIIWAADNGARVANLSYDVLSTNSTVSSASQYMYNKNGIVTVSSGNNGQVQTAPDNQYQVRVGAVDANDVVYSWSNRGSDLDLVAPGATHTMYRTGGYGVSSGTSIAAPHVAGLAGLLLSYKPTLTGPELQDAIKLSADDLGNVGWDSEYGWGRVNTYKALIRVGGNPNNNDTIAPTAPSNLVATASGNSGVDLKWTASTDNVGVTQYHIYRNNTLVRSIPGDVVTFSDTGLTSGMTYNYFVKAADAAGNISTASNTVTITLQQGFAWTTLPYVSSKTTTSVVITFATSTASTAVVEYWPRNGAHQTVNSASAISHNVTLLNLAAGGKYQYFVKVTSADGTTLTSVTSSFSTPRR